MEYFPVPGFKIEKCKNVDISGVLKYLRRSKRFSVRLGRSKKKVYVPFNIKKKNGMINVESGIPKLVFYGPSKATKVFFFIGKKKLLEIDLPYLSLPGKELKIGETLTIFLPTNLLEIS